MLHIFRTANNLAATQFDDLFIHKADLLGERLGQQDTIVFVDDFAGTGDQAITAWQEVLGELLPEGPHAFLVLAVAVRDAIRRITQNTPLQVRAFRRLGIGHNFFANECSYFSNAEKGRVLGYCRQADHHNPRGYGACGILAVMAHRCPNNSLPILHSRRREFRGLFPR